MVYWALDYQPLSFLFNWIFCSSASKLSDNNFLLLKLQECHLASAVQTGLSSYLFSLLSQVFSQFHIWLQRNFCILAAFSLWFPVKSTSGLSYPESCYVWNWVCSDSWPIWYHIHFWASKNSSAFKEYFMISKSEIWWSLHLDLSYLPVWLVSRSTRFPLKNRTSLFVFFARLEALGQSSYEYASYRVYPIILQSVTLVLKKCLLIFDFSNWFSSSFIHHYTNRHYRHQSLFYS